MTIEEYARAVAEAVREQCVLAVPGSFRAMPRDPMVMRDAIEDVNLDAIIASVPAPDVQAQIDLDCGDNSCRFATNRGGMRTNGGCRCFENAGFGPSAVGAALRMLPEIARLRAQLADVQAQIDAARAEEREACAKEAVEVVDSVTGPTGGWIASPREVRNAFIREIRARSGARGA